MNIIYISMFLYIAKSIDYNTLKCIRVLSRLIINPDMGGKSKTVYLHPLDPKKKKGKWFFFFFFFFFLMYIEEIGASIDSLKISPV